MTISTLNYSKKNKGERFFSYEPSLINKNTYIKNLKTNQIEITEKTFVD